mgnify:FL=1|tara:strand:+ start:2811 stop:3134 length:324 start_codon:yes stop_codon:yes gene_type:complete
MDHKTVLISLDRKDSCCILVFSDNQKFELEYLDVRKNCQCAKCKPRQANDKMRIEFEEEISRLMLVKPKVEQIGNYALRFEWPTGCSSGIHSFEHLRKISESTGKKL